MLLEFERGHGAAGEIVLHAAIAHGRPVAHGACGQHALRIGQRKQLLEGLHAVENSRTGGGNNGSLVRLEDEHISFGLHRCVEGELGARQQRLGGDAVGPEKNDPIDCCGPASFSTFGCCFLFKGGLKIACREEVIFVVTRHCHLYDAEGRGCAKISFARRRQQMYLGLNRGLNLGSGPS